MRPIILAIVILLSGCQTVTTLQEMRSLPEDHRIYIDSDTQWREVYRTILERMMMCQAFSAGSATVMATGNLNDEIGTVSLVSYVGAAAPHYLIVVDVKPRAKGAAIVATAATGKLSNFCAKLKYWAAGGQECTPRD